MKTVTVHASKTYDVVISRGLLAEAGARVKAVTAGSACALVTDDTVGPLWGGAVKKSLEDAGLSVCCFTFPHGEQSKNAKTYVALLEFLAEHQLTRADAVVALGGGVVGDLAGFAAATYLRGVTLVQIPTTLLAMVDSSVGGKTAIDLTAGKNLAGAFYQPSAVLCDLDTLNTLPKEIFADGCAEVIKYAVLRDPEILSLLVRPQENLEELISRCVAIKRDTVEEDERDTGARQSLNLGHTVAHAIEKLSGYTVSHGSAVAIGLATICCAAEKKGDCPPGTALSVMAALMRAELPVETEFELDDLVSAMAADKKRAGDTITLVIPKKIGEVELRKLPLGDLRDYIAAGL